MLVSLTKFFKNSPEVVAALGRSSSLTSSSSEIIFTISQEDKSLLIKNKTDKLVQII